MFTTMRTRLNTSTAAGIGTLLDVAALTLWTTTATAQSAPMVMPKPKALYELSSQVNWVAFRPKSTDLAVALFGGSDGGKAFVCKSWMDKQFKDSLVDRMPSQCFCVAFTSDGKRLGWCSWTPGKQISFAGDLEATTYVNCGDVKVTAVSFDPKNDRLIASVSTDGIVRIWDVNSRKKVKELPTAGGRGLCITYSSDGAYLAAAFANNKALVWRTADLDKPAIALESHTKQVNFLAFSPNSRRLATASADQTVKLWDCATGELFHTFEEQQFDSVTSIAFSPDGNYLASGDRSGKVVFWDTSSFKALSAFRPHLSAVYGIAISQDGQWFATGSQDKSVKIFATADLGYRLGRVRLVAVGDKMGVKVDGEPLEGDPKLPLRLPPGTHKITVTTEDESNSRVYTVEVGPDLESSVTVDVRSAFGKLLVTASQPTDVTISSAAATLRGVANEMMERLTPGRYTILLAPRDKRFSPENRTVDIKAGEIARLGTTFTLAFGDPSPPPDRASLGQIRVNPRDGAEMVWIPAGFFSMGNKNGDRDARTVHQVTQAGYWIYRRPVTVAQYRKFCEATKSHTMPPPPKWGWHDDHPMVMVPWQDAQAYGQWAFGNSGASFLPTESQYERAMQGPVPHPFPWGDEFKPDETVGSVGSKRLSSTQSVGLHAANGYGLFDIGGDVWEWCSDWYDQNYYKKDAITNPIGPATGKMRVIRGGAWDSRDAKMFRVDFRGKSDPSAQAPNIGFRCATG